MSAYAEVTKVQPPGELEAPKAIAYGGDGDGALVRLWRKRIEHRKNAEDFKEWQKYKDEAKKCGKGDVLDDEDVKSWQTGDTSDAPIVQVGLWPRIRAYYVDAIFSNQPNLAFRPKEGRAVANPQAMKQAASVEAMVKYVWEECKQQPEARRALRDAWNANVSAVEVVFDRTRGLYKGQWVAGLFIVDGECHGDLSRAMWVAKEMRVPASRILTDDTFDKAARLKLYEKWKPSLDNAESGGFETLKTVHYVCSREGVDPLAGVKELAGELPEGSPKKVLFAIVEGFDEFLFQAPDPYPYLDEDEYNFPFLTLAEEPGELYGTPQWKMLKGLLQAINWLVTFYVAAMKKKACTVALVNESIWADGATKLSGAKFMECFAVKGDPRLAALKLDLGSNDTGQLDSAERLLGWLEKISGFNQVAQGESTGRKTATEADSLQRNTALVVKGPSDSFDAFLNEWVRQVALASLYYIPQFSRVIGPDGTVMTQQVAQAEVPVPPALGPNGEPPDPNAPPQTAMQAVVEPAMVEPEEAQELGAVQFVQNSYGEVVPASELPEGEMPLADFGFRMPDTEVQMSLGSVDVTGQIIPGAPVFTHPTPGKVLRKGVDYFCGPVVAMDWPTQPLEDVKRDLLITFEAGSTRADWRHDKQQAAAQAIQLLGPIFQQTGGYDALYELVVAYTQGMPNDNNDHFVPARELFVGGMKAAAMTAQAMQEKEVEAKAKGAEKGPPKGSA